MADVDINKLIDTLKQGMTSLAESTVNNYKSQAISAGQNIIDEMKDDLKDWTEKVANGVMAKDDLEWLVGSQEVLLEMVALKQVGLAKVQLDNFKNGLVSLIVNTITSVI